MNQSIDLTGYEIFDIYGVERKKLKGIFTADRLAQTLIDEWVRHVECHKCGRSDYCKYVKQHSHNPHKMLDIQCGVLVDVMKNFMNSTFHLLQHMTPQQIQCYLDGAYYFSQFVYDAEQAIGIYMNEDFVRFFGEHSPRIFSSVIGLRERLNLLSNVFRDIPDFHSQRGVLFVEGWTEKVFLDKLRETHLLWFLNLIIEVYHGKGNRRPKRIEMLLSKYVEQGYKIYIQGDADGRCMEIFQTLGKKGIVGDECNFVFQHDFETAIPVDLLLAAFHDLGELSNVTLDDFIEKFNSKDASVAPAIREHFGLDIESIKLDLATVVAERINDLHMWNDKIFMETELGEFLRFVQKIV